MQNQDVLGAEDEELQRVQQQLQGEEQVGGEGEE